MNDVVLAAFWIAILGSGLAIAIGLRRLGLATTYVRDLVHIGASVWVFGWPYWDGIGAPLVIVTAALIIVALVPVLAERQALVARLRDSLAGGDERWSGVVLYVAAYAVLTPIGVAFAPFAAGAALLALAWGDGAGGFVGRRWGRLRFRVPWGKVKTLEGALAVAAFAALGAAVAALRFDAGGAAVPAALLVGLGAAAVEAVSPRATDNVLVPATAALLAAAVTGW